MLTLHRRHWFALARSFPRLPANFQPPHWLGLNTDNIYTGEDFMKNYGKGDNEAKKDCKKNKKMKIKIKN